MSIRFQSPFVKPMQGQEGAQACVRRWEEWPGLALRLGTGQQIAKATVEWETGWAERAGRDPVHSGSQGKFLDRVDTLL